MAKSSRKEAKALLALALCSLSAQTTLAQQEIYPQHFNLEQVTLLDGPFKKAMETNTDLLEIRCRPTADTVHPPSRTGS